MEHITNEQIAKSLNDHITKHDADFRKLFWSAVGIVITIVGAFFTWYGNYTALDQKVADIKEQTDNAITTLNTTKANKETVETQYANIMSAIGELKATLKNK